MVNLWSHFRCTIQENLDIADFITQSDCIAIHIITVFSFTSCSSKFQATCKACVHCVQGMCTNIAHTAWMYFKLTIKCLLYSLKCSNNTVKLIEPSWYILVHDIG